MNEASKGDGTDARDLLATLVVELCALAGPVGGEEDVRDWLVERWSPKVQEIAVGPTGNVLARVGGGGRRVAIVAHMDEIAFFVTALSDDGFLKAEPLGSRRPGTARLDLPIGHPARILTRDGGRLDGTFAAVTGHVANAAEAAGWGESDSCWWIDVGFSSASDLVRAGVHVGAPVVSAAPVRRLGSRLVGKAMDDRALLAAMTALVERPELAPRNELWLVATVQEEIGSVGAAALTTSLTPEVALALDVAPCGRLPGQPPDRFSIDLGRGPVLVHKDVGLVYDRALGSELREAAILAGRSLQDGAFPMYRSDGGEFARSGVRTALLTLPCRYTHSSFETIDLEDLEDLVNVLASWV